MRSDDLDQRCSCLCQVAKEEEHSDWRLSKREVVKVLAGLLGHGVARGKVVTLDALAQPVAVAKALLQVELWQDMLPWVHDQIVQPSAEKVVLRSRSGRKGNNILGVLVRLTPDGMRLFHVLEGQQLCSEQV